MQLLGPLFIGVLCLLIFPFPATAAQFTVNSTADQVDAVSGDGVCATASGLCTLRAAIQQANALVPAPVGGHIITLPAGTYTLTIPHDAAGPDDASGNLAIHNDLTISGAGTATTIIEGGPPPSPTDGVITVYSPGVFPKDSTLRAQISGVTIRDGNPRRHAGGGISNEATLDLTDVVVTGNRAGEIGGGIANVGTLTLTRSIVSGNTVQAGPGGGIHNQRLPDFTVGVVTLIDSTISGNTAHSGGGIANSGGDVTITNSTISGNTAAAEGLGGGIENSGGVVTITNSTISGNTAHSGGGIFDDSEVSINMKNTIVAGNTAFFGRDCRVASPVNSLGHNLVGNSAFCDITPAPGTTGDQVGDPESPIVPLLGTLADNGGPTRTHALLAGSPAINAGDNVDCPPTDQRGVLRPQGTACDIGAFEHIPLVATFATSAGQFSNLSAVPEGILPATGKPAGLTFPFGFFSWTVTDLLPGQTINVTITHPTALPVGAQYWKVTGGTWTDVTSLLGTSNADGDTVLTLTITDGGFGDEDAQANGQISDPGGVGLAPTSTVPFAVFIPEVEIKMPRGANNDTFEVEAFFTLGAGSDGIFPLTEDLTLDVGPYSTTIPAGSFKQKKGRFTFKGVIDGVRLAATIKPRARGGFKFEAEGKCADLDGTVNPVTVQLAIGDDVGSTETKAEIKSSRHGGNCGDRRDDDKDDKDDDDD